VERALVAHRLEAVRTELGAVISLVAVVAIEMPSVEVRGATTDRVRAAAATAAFPAWDLVVVVVSEVVVGDAGNWIAEWEFTGVQK
jgi:hypothetical protein